MNARESRAAHLVALASVPGVGPGTLLRCHAGDPASIWAALVAGRAGTIPELAPAFAAEVRRWGDAAAGVLAQAAVKIDPREELLRHEADGRSVLVLGEPDYPDRLAVDPAPPAVLFATGDLELLHGPSVAIVGTRNATRAGRELASRFAIELCRVGVSVVSGLALGIDGAAHQGAVTAATAGADGRPIGVVASGLDVAYPARHAKLHREVARQGVLVSETPLGQRPEAWRFPARNRIIAALSEAVVVVESRSRGGSILTAGEALTRDIPVLAVPGHPSAPASHGTNDLIYDGAVLVRDLDDVLVAIGRGGTRPVVAADPEPPFAEAADRPPGDAAVLEALRPAPLALDELLSRTGLDLGTVSAALTRLEGSGEVTRRGGWIERGIS